MALENLIASLVKDAFDILDDLPVLNATYVTEGDTAYDPATGTVSRPDTANIVIAKSVFAQFTQREMERDPQIDGSVDQKMIFPRLPYNFVVNDNDIVIHPDGTKWDVKKAVSVPGDSVAILHLRKR
jgi:hypothetical protein